MIPLGATFVFVTAYSVPAGDKLPQAMNSWVKVVQKSLGLGILPIYLEEAFRRFEFNVVEDQDDLGGASVDRVRAEYRDQTRGLCLDENDYYDDTVEKSGYVPSARNLANFLLDEAAIGDLPNDTAEFCIAYNPRSITVVDGFWNRSRQIQGTYRGIGQLGVSGLAGFYMALAMTADTGAMMDLHPIDG